MAASAAGWDVTRSDAPTPEQNDVWRTIGYIDGASLIATHTCGARAGNLARPTFGCKSAEPAPNLGGHYMRKFRDDLESEVGFEQEEYGHAVTMEEVDPMLMQLQMSYLKTKRKMHYMDHHGIMVVVK